MRSLLKRKLQRGIKWMVRLFYPFYLLIDFFRRREEVRILMYHKVSNLPPEREVPYCNVPVASFEAQMRFSGEERVGGGRIGRSRGLAGRRVFRKGTEKSGDHL
ncbi:MAG: hypothetical protein MPW15_27880 [Candidatus Manganitrophus sp.]|nr:hypothetical protein [Candidatus Manganitrophus sp.]